MSLRGSCCPCIRGEDDGAQYRDEVDYLLPGGEWDPSISGRQRSRRSGGGGSRGRGHSRDGTLADDGAESESGSFYTPPAVPGAAAAPPKSGDFRLLKTVGKGAFGKVRE